MRAARLLSFATCLLAITFFSMAIGITEAQAGKKFTLDVNAPAVGFTLSNEIPGAFQIQGTIAGGGTFQCWGWVLEGGAPTLVSQIYFLSDGQIHTQGREGGLLSVVGGTGAYKNARGQGLQTFIDDDNFTIKFELIGSGGAGS
jgi:hypothetical protein